MIATSDDGSEKWPRHLVVGVKTRTMAHTVSRYRHFKRLRDVLQKKKFHCLLLILMVVLVFTHSLNDDVELARSQSSIEQQDVLTKATPTRHLRDVADINQSKSNSFSQSQHSQELHKHNETQVSNYFQMFNTFQTDETESYANHTSVFKNVPNKVKFNSKKEKTLQTLPELAEKENLTNRKAHQGDEYFATALINQQSSIKPDVTPALPTTPSNITFSTESQTSTTKEKSPPKTILFYTPFFYSGWDGFLKRRGDLKDRGCPFSNCVFIEKSSHPEDADAVVFHAARYDRNNIPAVRRPQQRYIWLNLEAPSRQALGNLPGLRKLVEENWYGVSGFYNWTFTYHRDSDIPLLYGGLMPLKGENDLTRPGLLDTSGATYKGYMAALDRGDRLDDSPEPDFLIRPKMVVWMVSHCSTESGREFYVKELRKHLPVDVYGKCGSLQCEETPDNRCYSQVLRPNYKFYLAFENNMCDDYVTEKVWLPMLHGLVPVVYGGANYSQFLPPHSYVDATKLSPLQLARLLTSVGESPPQYARYHLWHRYWKVVTTPPLCELCRKLHQEDPFNSTTRKLDLPRWWRGVNHCYTRYPYDKYPRPPEPDPRTYLRKVKDAGNLLMSLISA